LTREFGFNVLTSVYLLDHLFEVIYIFTPIGLKHIRIKHKGEYKYKVDDANFVYNGKTQ